jgi:nicotinate-nucleotide adenylyltransferase
LARLGFLGGTFNPLHIGHLICAQEACLQLGLDRVLLMPVATPPHKEASADPGAEYRVEMCRRATAADPRLDVCDIELQRPGPSYTVDTLRAIQAEGRGDELTFIVGGDMASSFPLWREPEAILELAELGVAQRAGSARDEIAQMLGAMRGGDRVRFIEMPRVDISSSEIRRRVHEGVPIRYLVPDEVVAYIDERSLYRDPEAGA